jgi:hypothetical protein
MLALLPVGITIALVGAFALAEEWRQSARRPERRNGLRLEVVAVAAAVVGIGTTIAYVGIAR